VDIFGHSKVTVYEIVIASQLTKLSKKWARFPTTYSSG